MISALIIIIMLLGKVENISTSFVWYDTFGISAGYESSDAASTSSDVQTHPVVLTLEF